MTEANQLPPADDGRGLTEGLGLLPEREGQPRTLEMRMPWEYERGHWYSPAAVREMLAAERERCAKLCEQEHRESGEHPEMALHCAERIRGLRA